MNNITCADKIIRTKSSKKIATAYQKNYIGQTHVLTNANHVIQKSMGNLIKMTQTQN
jgi:hypothetical protein